MKSGLKLAKKKAWDSFSKYIRARDAIKTTGSLDNCVCVSCGRTYPAFGVGCIQAGHLIPGRTNTLLIDEKLVNGQCYHCNIGLKGNYVPYRRKMVQWYGEEFVIEAEDKRNDSNPMKAYQWKEIEDKYKELYKQLKESI